MMMKSLALLVGVLVVVRPTASTDIVDVKDDVSFEEIVMQSPHCWAVLFTSSTRDTGEAERVMLRVQASFAELSLARTDVDDVKAVASEFNVRKRMLPRLLLFNSRARQAVVIKLGEGPLDFDAVRSALNDGLSENRVNGEEGKYEKLTLAIGSGKSEL